MLEFKYNIGDRVDHSIGEGFLNSTPGTVYDRYEYHGEAVYGVEWDDGFTEEYEEGEDYHYPVNVWPEDQLVPLEHP